MAKRRATQTSSSAFEAPVREALACAPPALTTARSRRREKGIGANLGPPSPATAVAMAALTAETTAETAAVTAAVAAAVVAVAAVAFR